MQGVSLGGDPRKQEEAVERRKVAESCASGAAGQLSEDPHLTGRLGHFPPALGPIGRELPQGAKLPCASGCHLLAGQTDGDREGPGGRKRPLR